MRGSRSAVALRPGTAPENPDRKRSASFQTLKAVRVVSNHSPLKSAAGGSEPDLERSSRAGGEASSTAGTSTVRKRVDDESHGQLIDSDSDDESGRPAPLRKYVKTLSQRSLDYLKVLDSKDFLYPHMERPRPQAQRTVVDFRDVLPPDHASVLYQALDYNPRQETLSVGTDRVNTMLRASSSTKLAFRRPFDTQTLNHTFSTAQRWRVGGATGSRADDVLMGPGEYTDVAVDPIRKNASAKLLGKSRPAMKNDVDDVARFNVGPGSYNPPINGLPHMLGVYDNTRSSFASAEAPSYRVPENLPDMGTYTPGVIAGLDTAPNRTAHQFGAQKVGPDKDDRADGVTGPPRATPKDVGPGTYNPESYTLHRPMPFLEGRPPVMEHKTNTDRHLGPGTHRIGEPAQVGRRITVADTTVAGKVGPSRSIAGKPYAAPVMSKEQKQVILQKSQSSSSIELYRITPAGRGMQEEVRQEGYRVRDERIAIAAEVKKLQDDELESRRRYIEHKQEVRQEIRRERQAALHRSLSFAIFVKLAATAKTLSEKMLEMREVLRVDHERYLAATRIAKWWLRTMYFAKKRQKRLEMLARGTIRDKLIGYLERSRKTRKERSANAILTFLRASAKASPISRMVREALKRVKHLQRAFRRFLAMRAAKIQMAVEQWNWFEHKRVLKLERRKKQKSKQKEVRGLRASFGDGGADGGVKFGVAFGGAEDSKVGVAFKEGEQGIHISPIARREDLETPRFTDMMKTPRDGSETPRSASGGRTPRGIKKGGLKKKGRVLEVDPYAINPEDIDPTASLTPRSQVGSDGSRTPRFGGDETPRFGIETPRFGGDTPRLGSDTPRSSSSYGGETPRGYDGNETPRLKTPRSMRTPRGGETPRSSSQTPRLRTPRMRGRTVRTVYKTQRIHPMRNEDYDLLMAHLVLPDGIKRLKMKMFVKAQEKAHRHRVRKYHEAKARLVGDLRKQVDKKEVLHAAKRLLQGMDAGGMITEDEIRAKVEKAIGPPPIKSPWLPQDELIKVIDEALTTHYFSEEAKRKRAQEAAKRAAAAAARRPSISGPAGRRGSFTRMDSRRNSLTGPPGALLSDLGSRSRRGSMQGQEGLLPGGVNPADLSKLGAGGRRPSVTLTDGPPNRGAGSRRGSMQSSVGLEEFQAVSRARSRRGSIDSEMLALVQGELEGQPGKQPSRGVTPFRPDSGFDSRDWSPQGSSLSTDGSPSRRPSPESKRLSASPESKGSPDSPPPKIQAPMADWSGSTMAQLVPPPPMVRRGSIVEEMARAGGAEALRTSQTQAARRRGSFDTAQAPAAAMAAAAAANVARRNSKELGSPRPAPRMGGRRGSF